MTYYNRWRKVSFEIFLYLALLIVFFITSTAVTLAHQPQIVKEQKRIPVKDPEVSKAYYGNLDGQPVIYEINSSKPFRLYVGVLVPYVPNIDKDVSAEITKDGHIIAYLDGSKHKWTKFYEQFGGDTYWEGPAYKKDVDPGTYEIRLFSPDNEGKYVVAIGEKEVWSPSEIARTTRTLPGLKKDFFEKSPWTAYFNLSGLFLGISILVIIIIVIAVIFLVRKWRRKKGS